MIPDSVIGGDDVKPITARRQVRVKRLPARTGIDPAFVKAFQLISEAKPCRRCETQCRVVDAQVRRERRQTELCDRLELPLIGSDAFDHDRRGQPGFVQPVGIDYRQPVARDKPQRAVGCSSHARGADLHEFASKAIGCIVEFVPNAMRLPRRRFEFGSIDPNDPGPNAEPQVAVIVVDNGSDRASEDAVGSPDGREATAFEPSQPVERSDPKGSFAILVDARDRAGQAFLVRIRFELVTLARNQRAVCETGPDAPFPIGVGAKGKLRFAVRRGIDRHQRSLAPPKQAPVAIGEPCNPTGVCGDGHDSPSQLAATKRREPTVRELSNASVRCGPDGPMLVVV